jgi:type II secretory pathway pseudopilin PulG
MLLVFLMAAMIAIALYNELPRVAFEAQRSKEQLLIERGEQYKRAIQLFVRKVNRYPATIEELESLNNTRFLRKRYLDPMTGKEKWRLIHVNGGVLTDSIIQKNKPGQDQQQQGNTNTFIGEGPIMGATNDPSQQQINPAMRRRASDDRPVVTQEAPQAPPDPNQDVAANDGDGVSNVPASDTSALATMPGTTNAPTPGIPPARMPGTYAPGANPGQPGYNPAMANQPYGSPGSLPNQIPNGGGTGTINNGNTGQSNTGGMDSGSSGSVYVAPGLGQSASPSAGTSNGAPGQPGYPGQQGGLPGRPGMFPNQQSGFPGQNSGGFGGQSSGFGGQSSGFGGQSSGFGGQSSGVGGQSSGFGGQSSGFGSTPASSGQNGSGGFGNNMGLTSPSQMQPGFGPSGGAPGMGGTQVGGGIAGVASESTGPAIKVYNDRKKYNEWEFVYDQSKDRGLAGVQRGGGAPGTPAGQLGSIPGQQPGGNGFGNSGGSSGFGNSSFGNSGGAGNPGGSGTVSGGLFGGQSSSGFGQPTPQPQPQQPPN